MTMIKLTNSHGFFQTTASNMDKWSDILATYTAEKITAMIDECTGYYSGHYSDVTSKSEALVMWSDLNMESTYSKDELMAMYNRT